MAEVKLPCFDGEASGLPFVCMCCGRPATVVKSRVFNADRNWALLENNVLVQVPLCDRHKHYWLRPWWMMGGLMLMLLLIFASFLVVSLAINILLGLALFGVEMVAFVAVFIPLMVWHNWTFIRALRTGEHSITLINVAEEFARRVAQDRASHQDVGRPLAWLAQPSSTDVRH